MQNVKLNLNFEFPLPESLFKYLLTIDPALEWKARGLTGHNKNTSLKEQINLSLEKRINKISPEDQERLAHFLRNSYQIFSKLFYLRLPASLKDKKIFFVIGFMRTGGTYILTELCKIFNVDYKNLHLSFMHDDIPKYHLCKNYHIGFLFVNLLFELSLWINWLIKEWPYDKPIIKKRIAFAYIIKQLDTLFQQKATFLVTIRNPIDCAYSFAQLENIDIFSPFSPQGWIESVKKYKKIKERQWAKMPYIYRAILFWEAYYSDIVFNLPTKGKLIPICFGPKMLDFLVELARKENNLKYKPSNFIETKYKDIPKEVQEFANKSLIKVRKLWKLYDIKFPI